MRNKENHRVFFIGFFISFFFLFSPQDAIIMVPFIRAENTKQQYHHQEIISSSKALDIPK